MTKDEPSRPPDGPPRLTLINGKDAAVDADRVVDALIDAMRDDPDRGSAPNLDEAPTGDVRSSAAPTPAGVKPKCSLDEVLRSAGIESYDLSQLGEVLEEGFWKAMAEQQKPSKR